MFLNEWIRKSREYRNQKYNDRLKKEISFKKTPSIISNNCVGGVVYHNLGLQFKSPTINLYMNNEDFLLFVSNLQEFLSAELVEVRETKKPFPVGVIRCDKGIITIYFSHYESFAQAQQKWEQRTKRIDWENIVVIMEEGVDPSDDIVKKFEKLPYTHKVLLYNGNIRHDKVKQGFPFYIYDEKYYSGRILSFGRFKISKNRYLDEFDYVHFLNTGEIRKRNK